ncbi:MAG: DUF2269 family protein [Saprospiraceae bacterium]|nr:DUF2269 family protein [Saprospiraceae bacterium]
MAISKVTRISILNGLFLLFLTLAEFWGTLHFNLVFSYQWHKILHLAGVVILMGNMVVGPVWFSYAYYSGDKGLLKFACRLLQITDLYLMAPGIALTVVNGLFLASALGGSHNLPWLYYSVVLLILMWLLSIPVVYIQEKMYQVIDHESFNRLKINRLLTYWGILGTLVMIPPTIIFYLMVAKSI